MYLIFSYIAMGVLLLLVSAFVCYWLFSSWGLIYSKEGRDFLDAEDEEID